MASRIAALPRRDWTECDPRAVDDLSAALNDRGGQLRLIQAMAIRETLQRGGLFLNARVGAGKTLTGALIATLFEDCRPLILVPGGHGEKTEYEFAQYRAAGWQLSHKLQVVTYSDLARDVDERLLRAYQPGMLICDEADKLRRVSRGGSGTAARVAQYMAQHPSTRFVAMSGTMFKEGLNDYAHLLNWALKASAPVPELPIEIQQWHKAIKGLGPTDKIRRALGLAGDADVARAYRDRLWHSPGVIISIDSFTGVPLTLERVALGGSPDLDRLYAEGVAPSGLDVVDSAGDDAEGIDGTWAVERQLALGFYYKPDPEPPEQWKKARKAYFRWARARIAAGEAKTELQARRIAIRTKHPAWAAWEAIQPTFEPRFVPVWLNSRALEWCKEWGRGGGIVWTDHRAFADRLSAETGWRWFAGGGLDASGMMVEKCTDRTIICSRQANGTGRNLQRWNRGLVTALPGNGRDAEQLFGRQHREGQTQPVEMSILFACRAHHNDMRKVVQLSEEEEKEMGRQSKVLAAAWR